MAYWLDLYRVIMRVEIAERSAYRANWLLWLIGVLIEPLVYLVVWSRVAAARSGSIGGYTPADFAAYYLVMMVVRHLTSGPAPWKQTLRIRSGEMSGLLLRPVHPFHVDLGGSIAIKIITLWLLIPVVIVVGVLFEARFAPPMWSVIAFVLALLMALLIRFFMQYGMTAVGFWTDRTEGLFYSYQTLQAFFSGIVAPLSLLPSSLQSIAAILPFRWIFAFPVDLALGHLTITQALIGFAIQIAWIIVSGVSMVWLWQKGIRRYGAFGG